METGRVYTTATFQGEQIENSLQSIEQRFLSFIRNFRINTDFIYRDQIERNIRLEKWFLEVDLQHLIAYDEYLADDLKNRPKELVKLFESAIAKSQNSDKRFQLMLISRANPVFLRDLGSQYVSKLVRVSGIVVSANTLRSKATSLVMTCKSCKHTKTVSVPSGVHGFQLPRQCEAEQLDQNVKCPMDPYIINHFKSLYADQQLLKIQEPHGLVPVGELPRHVLICTDRFLTNKVTPGMRVTLTGIFDTFSAASKGKGKGDAVALMTPYIHVFGIQLDPNAVGSVRTFTPQEEEEFLAISRRPNVYEEFISSLAPQIFGSSDIKKAMACLLFSGSKSFLPDGMKLRGDVNVLLLGDPGTAKSQLLKFVEKVAPIAVYTSGKGSSAAGLTASVIKDSQTREFRLEAGAMVLGDGGVVCIDEFDKMRDEDRVAIHEAMEQQTISIAKAGITTVLNSRTSILAAANPVFGRYDDMKSPGENIDFQSTILSRFDLIFVIRDEHDATKDASIARHVVGVHMNTPQVNVEGDLDIQKMRSYITYCRAKCAPKLSKEAADKLVAHFVEMRAKVRLLSSDLRNLKTAIPITIRQLEAIFRITESIAKISLVNVATERHVDEAIRLFNVATMNAIQCGAESGQHGHFADQVNKVQDTIRKRFSKGSTLRESKIKEELCRSGFEEVAVDRAIYQLVAKGVLAYAERRSKLTRVRD